MDRRGFLKSTGAAAALAASAGSASAQSRPDEALASPPIQTTKSRTFSMSLPWAENVAGPADIAHRLALSIRQATGDRIKLELECAACSPSPSAAGLSEADFHFGSEHDRTQVHPAFSFFAGLPAGTGLSAQNLVDWITVGGGQDAWDELSAAHGTKSLLAAHLGAEPMIWSNKDLSKPEALRGARIAISGPAADVAQALGAKPIAIPLNRLPAALANGEIDATEVGGTLNAMSIGLSQAARFAYRSPLNPAGTALALSVNLEAWHALSPADRAIIASCAANSYRTSLAEARLAEPMLLQTLKQRNSVEIAHMPTMLCSTVSSISKSVIADLAGHDAIAGRINASYMAFRQHTQQIPTADQYAGPTAHNPFKRLIL